MFPYLHRQRSPRGGVERLVAGTGERSQCRHDFLVARHAALEQTCCMPLLVRLALL
jgi:hypothetical protein